MLDFVLKVFSVLIVVIFISLLIFGLLQCKKHNFKAGFYFFLFMIVHQVVSFISPLFLNHYIDTIYANDHKLSGLTLGQLVALLTYIIQILEVVAFSFLVIGLYRMWKAKGVSSPTHLTEDL